jgi:hypothetical protein
MPDWSIKFVPAKHPTPDKAADFVLDVAGDPPGPFDVFQGDLVSWNNTTAVGHQPAVFAAVQGGDPPPTGKPTPVGDILKQHQSSPAYPVSAAPGWVIRFCCTQHSGEFSVMVVGTPGGGPGPPPTV